MSSVWHRSQCNIGPGISPVTISTMDDNRKRPVSPGLASSTRRRRGNGEMNAHRMLGAITAAVVVVVAVPSSVTHYVRFRYQEGHQREESSPRPGGVLRRPRRARPRLFQASVPDASADLRKTYRCTASPASTRPPFPRTLLDEMMSSIH